MAANTPQWLLSVKDVSTHSHPKVAAQKIAYIMQFWAVSTHSHPKVAALFNFFIFNLVFLFQHTATRRWLHHNGVTKQYMISVSTHSHPKVAACKIIFRLWFRCRFNTQPPEGGCFRSISALAWQIGFQHTATRRWLQPAFHKITYHFKFQHTATRRWLPAHFGRPLVMSPVSTHSHPKVAAPYIKKQEKSAN